MNNFDDIKVTVSEFIATITIDRTPIEWKGVRNRC